MLESLCCNSCGAPLEVPTTANFVKCTQCGSNLKVTRSEGVVLTQAVVKLDVSTKQLAHQVNRLKLQNDLQMLDQEWEKEREQYLIHTKHRAQEPSIGTALLQGGVPFGFGLFVTYCGLTSYGPNHAPAFGILIAGAGIAIGLSGISKATRYQAALERHRTKREELSAKVFS